MSGSLDKVNPNANQIAGVHPVTPTTKTPASVTVEATKPLGKPAKKELTSADIEVMNDRLKTTSKISTVLGGLAFAPLGVGIFLAAFPVFVGAALCAMIPAFPGQKGYSGEEGRELRKKHFGQAVLIGGTIGMAVALIVSKGAAFVAGAGIVLLPLFATPAGWVLLGIVALGLIVGLAARAMRKDPSSATIQEARWERSERIHNEKIQKEAHKQLKQAESPKEAEKSKRSKILQLHNNLTSKAKKGLKVSFNGFVYGPKEARRRRELHDEAVLAAAEQLKAQQLEQLSETDATENP